MFDKAAVTLSVGELVALLITLALCLLLRLNRTGLVISFAFAYRWGWMFFRSDFGGQYGTYLTGYCIFGALVFILIILNSFLGYWRGEE